MMMMNLSVNQHQSSIHPSDIWKAQSDWERISRAEHAGSFPVVGGNQDERLECVRRMLLQMKNVGRTRPVLLAISLSGIKVCTDNGESILMAHALKRISYSTCHPEFCQFSFLAREPKAHTNFQHCHVFITENAQEAEEVNSVVAIAFSVAYACQRRSSSRAVDHPTFTELTRLDFEKKGFQKLTRQHEETQRISQAVTPLTPLTPLVDHRLRERSQSEREEREKRICQAKKTFDFESRGSFLPGDQRRVSSPLIASDSTPDSTSRDNIRGANVPLCSPEALGLLPSGASNPGSCSEIRMHQRTGDSVDDVYLSPVSCCLGIPKMDATGSELEFPVCCHMVEEKSLSDDEDLVVERSSNSCPDGVQGSEVQISPPTGITEGCAASRPLSGKYQNEETIRKTGSGCSSRGGDGRDIYQGPPTPIRNDSLRKMMSSQRMPSEDLQDAVWYQPGIPREMTLDILSQHDLGSFVIRDSTTHSGCFALSVKVPRYDNPSGISHYLITRTAQGYFKIKGLEKEWPTLGSLVTHHTVMRELLPCLLHLPRSSNTILSQELDKEDGNY